MKTLKTLNQVDKKIEKLKNELEQQGEVYENFGDKQIRQLDNYIGDIYGYSYSERLSILTKIKNFVEWCGNYTK